MDPNPNQAKFGLILVILCTISPLCKAEISDMRLCGDIDCKSPISYAVALQDYAGIGRNMLSFKKGDKIVVTSHSAGRRSDLWGGEIQGSVPPVAGYFPKSYVEEYDTVISNPAHTVKIDVKDVEDSDVVGKTNAMPDQVISDASSVKVNSATSNTPVTANTATPDKPVAQNTATLVAQNTATPVAQNTATPDTPVALNTATPVTENTTKPIAVNTTTPDKSDTVNTASTATVTNTIPHKTGLDSARQNPEVKPAPVKGNEKEDTKIDDVSVPPDTPTQSYSTAADDNQHAHLDEAYRQGASPDTGDVKVDNYESSAQPETEKPDPADAILMDAKPDGNTDIPPAAIFGGHLQQAANPESDVTPPKSAASETIVDTHPEQEVKTESELTDKSKQTQTTETKPETEANAKSVPSIETEPKPPGVKESESAGDALPEVPQDASRDDTRSHQPDDIAPVVLDGGHNAEDSAPLPAYGFGTVESLPTSSAENVKPEEKAQAGPILMRLEPIAQRIMQALPAQVQGLLETEPIGLPAAYTLIVAVLTTVFAMLASCWFLIGGSKGDSLRRKLLVKCNELERQLMIVTNEKETVQETLATMEGQAKSAESKACKNDGQVNKLQKELQTSQLHTKSLRHELDTLEEKVRVIEEQWTHQQSLLQEKTTEALLLQSQLGQYEQQTSEITTQLQQVHSLLAGKESVVMELEGQMTGLSEELNLLTQSKQQLLSQSHDWNDKIRDLEETTVRLEKDNQEINEILLFKNSEIEVLKDCMMQLKVFENEVNKSVEDAEHTEEAAGQGDKKSIDEKISDMINVSRMQAILTQVEENKISLQQKLIVEIEDRKEMEDQVKKMQIEIENLKSDNAKSHRECQEALTKLSVLSNYFKEKEMEMQKELGEQQVRSKQSSAQLNDVGSKTREIERELTMYKEQVDDLKQEIVNVERDYKNQLSANEKKVHENWLAARAAERELKEAKLEMAQLRQKMNEMERQRLEVGPEGLLRPLPTRIAPMMNGPPPPMHPGTPDRPNSRPSPHMRDHGPQSPPMFDGLSPPMHPLDRRPPILPPGVLPPPAFMGGPPPPPFMGGPLPPMDRRMMEPPPFDRRGPRERSPPPLDRRPSSEGPQYDRHTPPDRRYPDNRRTPPYRGGPPPPHYRGGALPPPPANHRRDDADHYSSRDKTDPSSRKV